MPGDFSILGLAETADAGAIRRAFRARAKELHPDLAPPGEALECHLRFAELCAAYGRLKARDLGRPLAAPVHAGSGRGLARQPDPAYALYRTGMGFFMRIHPSQWNLDPEVLNTRIAGHDDEQARIRERLEDLIGLFPRAYYYFGLVAEEYPDSDWAWDSGEKLRRIEDLELRYSRILDSFSSWNPDRMSQIREYHRLFDAHGRMRASISPEEVRHWREGR